MTITNIKKADPSIANRYLADQLTQAERETFEEHLVQDPAVLRELEATARFKRGLQKLRDSGKLDELVADRSSAQRWWMSAAAAIAIFALTFGLLWRIESSPPMMASTVSTLVDREGHPLSVGATYALFRTRGTDHDAVITLPSAQQAIELRVLPDSNMQPPYRVTLMSPGGGADGPDLTSVADLRPAEDGFVSVFIDSQRLAPGDYVVAVSGAGTEPGTQFLIRLNSSN